MKVAFSKYHGCGNDFVLIKQSDVAINGIDPTEYAALARRLCHRQIGIGADGLIIVSQNPLEMIFYNQDGSRAPMCGNGIRCLAKFCDDEDITKESAYAVKTLAGRMGVQVVQREPFLVCIKMGRPIFQPEAFGVKCEGSDFIEQKIPLARETVTVSSCFMGTVHTVLWADEIRQLPGGHVDFDECSANYRCLKNIGRELESHAIYTEKTNVNMAERIDQKTIRLQTYERGVGMTYACGTGACASVVIGSLLGKCARETDVLLPYGTLHIEWQEDGEVRMTGPAEKICGGICELKLK